LFESRFLFYFSKNSLDMINKRRLENDYILH
jgi:hypothetical protein